MASDPRYVKLADHLTGGIVCDLESGWSVSGLDVVEFPDWDDAAAAFVRSKLKAGALDEADEAEFQAIADADEAVGQHRPTVALPEQLSNWQENRIQAEAAAHRKAMMEKRSHVAHAAMGPRGAIGETATHTVPGELLEEQEKERRQAILDEREERQKAEKRGGKKQQQAERQESGGQPQS
jgi:hypothetical protein